MNTSAEMHESTSVEERLSRYLRSVLQPIPLLAGITAGGFLAIFWMGRAGILEPLGWQIIGASAALLFLAAIHLAIIELARARHGLLSYMLYSLTTGVTAILLSLQWQGITPVAVLIAWLAPASCLTQRIPRLHYILSLVIGVAATAAILSLDSHPLVARLATGTTASLAAVLLLTSMVVLFALVTIATQMRYRTLRRRLVGSLVPIIAVPILFMAAISAYSALTSSQKQVSDTLQAVSSLRRDQVDVVTRTIFTELRSLQEGFGQGASIMHVLNRQAESEEDYRMNASVASTQVRDMIANHPASQYEEVFVMDLDGNVVLSTYLLDEGVSFKDQDFFRQGLARASAQLIRFPGKQNAAGDFKLVASAPFYGATEQEILGVVVSVSNSDVIAGIMGSTPGLAAADTYLVNRGFRPVTRMSSPTDIVSAPEIRRVIAGGGGSGSSLYTNYAGVPVLGSYDWDPSLNAAIVAEIPQSSVATRALAALLTSGLVGLLTIAIAVIAVLSTSRAVSEPVSALADVAGNLASGHLATRAPTDRGDEIGRLAGSFNSMANQLQAMIASLERRVADRTRDLELQTNRLRQAAEIARDATLAPTLEELLNRAARLIMERFEPSFAGIYLLDERKQYAILQAAPSETGRAMLQAGYRIAVGRIGMVGQVSATGESMLALQRDRPAFALGDEYHTSTRSELAVPLKTGEGIIGVLDLQSDQPAAFGPPDITVMQVLADQLAAAIDRSRLLLRVQERLGQLEQAYRSFTERSWGGLGREVGGISGYKYDNVRLDPVSRMPETARTAMDKGETHITTVGGDGYERARSAAIPIRLRGKTLGIINVNFRHGRAPERTIAMIEQAAERLGTAIENVRLLEDSLRRANKERLIGDLTAKIGTSINMRNLLQTAVEELGRALPGSDVSIDFRAAAGPQEKETKS
jgi:GAF domain-containing protein/HAMP domain-containing protein